MEPGCPLPRYSWDGKKKDKLFPVFKHHAMKTCGECIGIAPPFLTSPLDGCDGSNSRPGRFILGEGVTVPIEQKAGQAHSRSGHREERN
jgi:hypothetical protein